MSTSTTAMTTIAIAMTTLGPILTPFSFSVSKYLMSPADDWKPLSFFFAIPIRIKGRYKYYCPRGQMRIIGGREGTHIRERIEIEVPGYLAHCTDAPEGRCRPRQ